MIIRFLQNTVSSNPDYPFQAGQIIRVDDPAPFLHLLDGVRAEAVPDTEPEYATVRAPRRKRADSRAH